MRGIFGLVSILVVVAIVVWLWTNQTATVATAKKGAEEQAAQIAGHDTATGKRASESAEIDLVSAGGKPDSILIMKVVPGGAYEKFYGLRQGDTILQLGELPVKGHPSITSNDDAEASLMETYQRSYPIVVVRDGNQITLPQPGARQQPAPDSGSKSTDPLQQQIEGIGGRRGL